MHGLMDKLARLFALLGGTVLTVLIVQTCLSIAGRSINSVLHNDFMQTTLPGFANAVLATGIGPINGDFELIEAGMAFVIFAFLPLCQLHGAHASVDIFTSKLPRRASSLLRMITEIVFAAIIVMIAAQLFQGMLSKMNSGQTTFLLQFPLWWAYALSCTGAFAGAIIAIYIAVVRMIEVITDTAILPDDMGAEH